MTDQTKSAADYSETLFLPKTDFPMRAGLPEKEPKLLERWIKNDLYGQLRKSSKGRAKFVLHDGPPYANGNIHIGHALNKILKDLVTRSQQMSGFDSNYVPGWDCHGLPIEWKIEEEYRAKGLNKDDVDVVEFRRQCRAFAENWVNIQREEFKRLGGTGDWDHPYLTMTYPAEAQIAREIMKFAENGLLYRGSKPVMWSVVEKTALAEAEVEYHDHTSDWVFVAFPVKGLLDKENTLNQTMAEIEGEQMPIQLAQRSLEPLITTLQQMAANYGPLSAVPGATPDNLKNLGFFDVEALIGASVIIWTTTPWTLPGNRAIAFSNKISYGLYKVEDREKDYGPKIGSTYIIANKLADSVAQSAKITLAHVKDVDLEIIQQLVCAHPLAGFNEGYSFPVPLLDGEHVTDDAGTGFVHTAPGHGREDYDLWMKNRYTGYDLIDLHFNVRIPSTIDGDSFYTEEAPGFAGKRVITDKGEKGDANEAVIKALIEAGNLVARGRLKHQYPHSWRSKKPVIFRNTPQWFVAMDKPFDLNGKPMGTLRSVSLGAIKQTEWVPAAGENRINGMIENRPDWVMSRQRAWGVPITVFVANKDLPAHKLAKNALLVDATVNKRIADAFEKDGGDAWFLDKDGSRFLSPEYNPADFDKVMDVLDVWFDSGSTHSYVLNTPEHFPGLADIHRKVDGGKDTVMYLEGSDQHRGWFHSSLLESCGTRGRAPYDVVLTHGFCLDEKGQKMSKSLGNVTAPQQVIKDSGADILRLWVAASDYSDDLRIGKEILKTFVETYRKMRNTIRWMLGSLAHFEAKDAVAVGDMPELERLMLHRLAELAPEVRAAYAAYDYKRVVSVLAQFMNTELSAFYFDIRKDTLYCDPQSSIARRASLTVIDRLFHTLTTWLAPIIVFTAEEAWIERYKGENDPACSVHLQGFAEVPAAWLDEALAAKWEKIKAVRRVVTGALEIERAAKRIGSSLEAAPVVYITDAALAKALDGVDFADICITSAVKVVSHDAPEDAFRLSDVAGVGVVPQKAEGVKCARSWRYFDPATADPAYPDVTPRDARALRERAGQG